MSKHLGLGAVSLIAAAFAIGCGGVAHTLGGDGQNESEAGGAGGDGGGAATGGATQATGGDGWGAGGAGAYPGTGGVAYGGYGPGGYGGEFGGAGGMLETGGSYGCGAYSGSGASGGYVCGAGGAAPYCDPNQCPSVSPPGLNFTFSGCCLPSGACGVSTDLVSLVLPVESTCVPYDSPGEVTAECPTHSSPVGPPTIEGCCLPEGICGYDLSLIHAGCVISLPQGSGGGVAVGGASGGGAFPGAGGLPGTGGAASYDYCHYTGAGGFGGFGGFGAYPGTGGYYAGGGYGGYGAYAPGGYGNVGPEAGGASSASGGSP